MSRRSLVDILNTGFGVLNPRFANLSGKNYNSGGEGSGFFNGLFQSINLSNVSFKIKGPMVGICLRNDGRVSESGWIDPECWAAVSSELIEEGSEMDLVQIRVRIPEIHTHLPIPRDLPHRLQTDESHEVINQYPVFVSQYSSVADPAHGDLVWVDFQDRANKRGPIYIGMAEANGYGGKSTSEALTSDEERKEKIKRRKGEKVETVATGTSTGNTRSKSRVFIAGDSNTRPMTEVHTDPDEFLEFYEDTGQELFENAINGATWNMMNSKIIPFLENEAGEFTEGDVFIVGSIGGNESGNPKKNSGALFKFENEVPVDVGGKYSKGSGYSWSDFDSIVDKTKQTDKSTNILNKSIDVSSGGYKRFANNSQLKKLTEKLVEIREAGCEVIVFGPPIGGDGKRKIDRKYLDLLQEKWFTENGIRYISVFEKSKQLIPNKDDVHYGRSSSSGYTEYFNLLIQPNL